MAISNTAFSCDTDFVKVDSCLFSENGNMVLLYEMKKVLLNNNLHLLYTFHNKTRTDKIDTLIVRQDSIHKISYSSYYDFVINKSYSYAEFKKKWKLFVHGKDITKETTIQVDAVTGTDSGNDCISTYIVSYALPGLFSFTDSVLCSNVQVNELENIYEERKEVWTEDCLFRGYIGYGTKIYTHPVKNTSFLRTAYVYKKKEIVTEPNYDGASGEPIECEYNMFEVLIESQIPVRKFIKK